MKILSHRGYWRDVAEKNQPVAFERSLASGFGIETDIRDCAGTLVIAHDMPKGNEMSVDDFLAMCAGHDLPLALNIKADGMARLLLSKLKAFKIREWFVFDMSIPETRNYFSIEANVFLRMSEFEPEPVLIASAKGVWLDGFDSVWYKVSHIQNLLSRNLDVCVVSPELHRRDKGALWQTLLPLASEDKLLLCTDYPEEARNFFKVNA